MVLNFHEFALKPSIMKFSITADHDVQKNWDQSFNLNVRIKRNCQNPDIFFQAKEAANTYCENVPDVKVTRWRKL